MFLKLFSPFTLLLPLPPTLPLPPKVLILSPARPRGRGRTPVRAYITPLRVLPFCSFSPLPLVGVVGFAWQCPF
jgi:hypothetical protein